MSCLLVTPNEDLLFNEAMIQTRTLRFHKLSKLLKQRTRELMAKFSGFFRKSNEETLTAKIVDDFIMGLNSGTSNTRPNSWVCIGPPVTQMEPIPYKEIPFDDDCEGEYYEEGCECEECCNYREDNDLGYTECEYAYTVSEPIPEQLRVSSRRRGRSSAIKEEGKPSEPKKWYEKGAIVLPF